MITGSTQTVKEKFAPHHDFIYEKAVGEQLVNRKERTCPCCGKPKLRVKESSSDGTFLGGCSGCGITFGNIVQFVAAIFACGCSEATRIILRWLGREGGSHFDPNPYRPAPKRNTTSPATQFVIDEVSVLSVDNPLSAFFALSKPGIRPEGLFEFEPKVVQWRQSKNQRRSQTLIGIPVYRWLYEGFQTVNWRMYPWIGDGIRFYTGRDEYRKTLLALCGSELVGVSMRVRDKQAIEAGRPIKGLRCFHCEGEPDAMALSSVIPSDEPAIIWTNSDGCYSTSSIEWMLPLLERLEPECHVVIHDRDAAGIESAEKWCGMLGPTSINVALPLPFSEKRGADLRDWIAAGATWNDFDSLVRRGGK